MMVSYYATFLGLGVCLGPVFGSLFMGWFGYIGAFYMFTVIISIVGGVCVFVLPSRINNKAVESKEVDTTNHENEEFKATYAMLLKNRSTLSALLICVFGFCCNCFLDPILSVRLIDLGM